MEVDDGPVAGSGVTASRVVLVLFDGVLDVGPFWNAERLSISIWTSCAVVWVELSVVVVGGYKNEHTCIKRVKRRYSPLPRPYIQYQNTGA